MAPPPEALNFAAHLLAANSGRPNKAAFIGDLGVITYGELDNRARRFAAALKERGVKREERALILMQDGADWPVAFLGAMLAGVAPVAVNTLLTADDLAYMLEHSRAQVALGSGAVKPALKARRHIRPRSPHRGRVASRAPSKPARSSSRISYHAAPLMKAARTHADDLRFASIRLVRPGGRRGRYRQSPTPIGRPSFTARQSWACTRRRLRFSAAKLFFAMARQRLTFSARGRALRC